MISRQWTVLSMGNTVLLGKLNPQWTLFSFLSNKGLFAGQLQ